MWYIVSSRSIPDDQTGLLHRRRENKILQSARNSFGNPQCRQHNLTLATKLSSMVKIHGLLLITAPSLRSLHESNLMLQWFRRSVITARVYLEASSFMPLLRERKASLLLVVRSGTLRC